MHGIVDRGLLRTTKISDLFGIRADVILIDAPYRFRTWSPRGESRCPQAHYRCANYDELAALPLAKIAGRDCRLFSWTPNPHMPVVAPLMQTWGFEYSNSGLVWVKTNKTRPGYWMGGGLAGTRKNVEIAWEGRRGNPKRAAKGVRELIVAPRREHSRKRRAVRMHRAPRRSGQNHGRVVRPTVLAAMALLGRSARSVHTATHAAVRSWSGIMTACTICGRILSDPISIQRGIGPVCRGRIHPESHKPPSRRRHRQRPDPRSLRAA
jgi:N6-adenosine-specific RNA methylase IME4